MSRLTMVGSFMQRTHQTSPVVNCSTSTRTAPHSVRFVLLMCAFGLLWAGRTAQANIGEAVKQYQRGYAMYHANKTTVALSHFLRARRALPQEKRYKRAQVALYFYIGACYHRLKQYPKARPELKAYLKDAKYAPKHKAQAKKLLNDIQKHIGTVTQQPRRPQPRKVRPAPPKTISPRVVPSPRPRRPQRTPLGPRTIKRPLPTPRATRVHPAGWALTGIGLATLAGGALTGYLAQQQSTQAQQRFTQQQSDKSLQASEVSVPFRTAQTQGTIANILFVSGGVLTGTGMIMLIAWRTPVEQ